jgi:hypothetical protein
MDSKLDVYTTAGGLGLSAVAAMISYYGVENVARGRRVKDSVFWPVTAVAWGSLLLYTTLWQRTVISPVQMQYNGTPACITQDHYYVPVSSMHAENIFESEPCCHFIDGKYRRRAAAVAGGILMVGDSHCEQYGNVIDDLAAHYNVTTAFQCSTQWRKPALTPGIVIFSISHRGYGTYGRRLLQGCLTYVLAHKHTKLLLLGDPPALLGGHRYLHNRYRREGNMDFLATMTEAAPGIREKVNAAYISIAKAHTRVTFADAAPYFMGPKYLRIVNPTTGKLDYADSNHLTKAGAWRPQPRFREFVFGDRTAGCP